MFGVMFHACWKTSRS